MYTLIQYKYTYNLTSSLIIITFATKYIFEITLLLHMFKMNVFNIHKQVIWNKK